MATIGDVILTNNTDQIRTIDAVEIGIDDAIRVVIDFDVDDALKRFSRNGIVDAYVSGSTLKMIYIK